LAQAQLHAKHRTTTGDKHLKVFTQKARNLNISEYQQYALFLPHLNTAWMSKSSLPWGCSNTSSSCASRRFAASLDLPREVTRVTTRNIEQSKAMASLGACRLACISSVIFFSFVFS